MGLVNEIRSDSTELKLIVEACIEAIRYSFPDFKPQNCRIMVHIGGHELYFFYGTNKGMCVLVAIDITTNEVIMYPMTDHDFL